ncbi:unnamed protein product [Dibothriocephalus latus]|uniref:Tektin n=1 Tax=Dibothriocephalus latus TaxID=60516 RepID=A0A3P7P460_DIBLA|nr:unnamed protein product [Dibothriocephalus latus]
MQLEIRTMLQASIDDALEQLRILTEDLHALNIQMREKVEARDIDIEQYNRNEKSGQIGFKPFCEREEEGRAPLTTAIFHLRIVRVRHPKEPSKPC